MGAKSLLVDNHFYQAIDDRNGNFSLKTEKPRQLSIKYDQRYKIFQINQDNDNPTLRKHLRCSS
jgi:hypothetical protein